MGKKEMITDKRGKENREMNKGIKEWGKRWTSGRKMITEKYRRDKTTQEVRKL